MRKKFLLRLRAVVVVWMICAALTGAALASDSLVPVGEVVGIRVTVDGVLVAGTSEIETENGPVSPAREAGIRPGDVIVAVNDRAVDSAAELVETVAALDDSPAQVTVMRNGRRQSFSVTPAAGGGNEPRLGLWLRDGISGIGTVTYFDPQTGAFGALGHGVNDMESGALLPVDDGSVCRAQVVDVRPGRAGEPGELEGSVFGEEVLGRIEKNTPSGIFGTLAGMAFGPGETLPVAAPAEVTAGPATILACVAGGEAREYDVEISRTGLAAADGRDLIVRVTDPELLAVTGGIVQGMSGSPILQNGRLVGAVTHVLVGDATRGYGIFVEHMRAEAQER